jgi:hypothetical protein
MNGVVYEKLEWLIGSWISGIEEIVLLFVVAGVKAVVEAAAMQDEEDHRIEYQL